MNQKAMVHIEIVKDEKQFTFAMPVGAPLGLCYDAAFEVLGAIVDMAKVAADRAKQEDRKEDA